MDNQDKIRIMMDVAHQFFTKRYEESTSKQESRSSLLVNRGFVYYMDLHYIDLLLELDYSGSKTFDEDILKGCLSELIDAYRIFTGAISISEDFHVSSRSYELYESVMSDFNLKFKVALALAYKLTF